MKFICDIMLGKLAKYLRMAGIDASYSNSISRSRIFSTAAAEQRTVLTRRTCQLLSEQQAASYFIQSNYPYEQLQDVIRHFNLQPDSSRFFTRCLVCNELLAAIEKASVVENVPDFVFSTVNEFARCPRCAKIFWKGTHYGNMIKRLENLLGAVNEGIG